MLEKEEAIVLVGKFFYHLWFSEEKHFVHKATWRWWFRVCFGQLASSPACEPSLCLDQVGASGPAWLSRLQVSYAVFFGNSGMLTRRSSCVWGSFPDSPLLVRAHLFVYQIWCCCSGGGLILFYTSEMRCSILAIQECALAMSTSVLFVLCWIAGNLESLW